MRECFKTVNVGARLNNKKGMEIRMASKELSWAINENPIFLFLSMTDHSTVDPQ